MDQRSFLLGFMYSTAVEEYPRADQLDDLREAVAGQCRLLKMTPPDNREFAHIVNLMAYVYNLIWSAKK
jgi:hypothetical protein